MVGQKTERYTPAPRYVTFYSQCLPLGAPPLKLKAARSKPEPLVVISTTETGSLAPPGEWRVKGVAFDRCLPCAR